MITRPQQHEIDAMVETALQTKLRNGYTQTAVVGLLNVGKKCASLGFNFSEGRTIGDVVRNDDGSIYEVLALV